MILLGLIILAVLFYLLGRSHVQPQILSHILPSPTVAPGASPDQVVQQFFQAVQQKDVQRVLSFCHPELNQDDKGQLVELIKKNSSELTRVSKVEIENIEESAFVLISITEKDGRVRSESFELRKYQGQWLIRDF